MFIYEEPPPPPPSSTKLLCAENMRRTDFHPSLFSRIFMVSYITIRDIRFNSILNDAHRTRGGKSIGTWEPSSQYGAVSRTKIAFIHFDLTCTTLRRNCTRQHMRTRRLVVSSRHYVCTTRHLVFTLTHA